MECLSALRQPNVMNPPRNQRDCLSGEALAAFNFPQRRNKPACPTLLARRGQNLSPWAHLVPALPPRG